MKYKAFISYSHAVDGALAPALQRALYLFNKPWYRRRAIRVFRDRTTLSATPALWQAIENALNESEYFLLLASPAAAGSEWVGREVEWWVMNRSTKSMLILLTEGELAWDRHASDFDWYSTTSLARRDSKMFNEEPLWVDLRWARRESELSLRHVQFRGAVLDIAEPLYGKPKDELDGDDVRTHRRTVKIAWIAGLMLLVFSAIALLSAVYATKKKTEAAIAEQNALIEAANAKSAEANARHAKESAEDALAVTFLRTIGVSKQPDISFDEQTSLWELAELPLANIGVKDKLIDYWFSSDRLLARAFARPEAIQATIGLNVELQRRLRSKATAVLYRDNTLIAPWSLMEWIEPQTTDHFGYKFGRWLMEAQSLEGQRRLIDIRLFAARMSPEQAESFGNALVAALGDAKSMDPEKDGICALCRALAMAVKRMKPEAAGVLSSRGAQALIERMQQTTQINASILSDLGDALEELTKQMKPDDVVSLADQLVSSLMDPNASTDRVIGLGNVLSVLLAGLRGKESTRIAFQTAEVLVAALEKPLQTDWYRLQHLQSSLSRLAPCLSAKDALSFSERLVTQLEATSRSSEQRILNVGRAVAALSARIVNPEQIASRCAKYVLPALDTLPSAAMDPAAMDSAAMAGTLADLLSHMGPTTHQEIAIRGADIVLGKLEAIVMSHDSRFYMPPLAETLARFADKMSSGAAASYSYRGGEVMVRALEPAKSGIGFYFNDSIESEGWQGAMARLAARMEARDVATLIERATRVWDNDPDRNTSAAVLAGLATHIERKDAVFLILHVIKDAAKHIAPKEAGVVNHSDEKKPESIAEYLSGLGLILGVASRSLEEAKETRLLAFLYSLQAGHDTTDICSTFDAQDLAEIFKWPFCIGLNRQTILAQLEAKTGTSFGGDSWVFVEKAPALGIRNIDVPAKRPRIEKALAEIETLAKATQVFGSAVKK